MYLENLDYTTVRKKERFQDSCQYLFIYSAFVRHNPTGWSPDSLLLQSFISRRNHLKTRDGQWSACVQTGSHISFSVSIWTFFSHCFWVFEQKKTSAASPRAAFPPPRSEDERKSSCAPRRAASTSVKRDTGSSPCVGEGDGCQFSAGPKHDTSNTSRQLADKMSQLGKATTATVAVLN